MLGTSGVLLARDPPSPERSDGGGAGGGVVPRSAAARRPVEHLSNLLGEVLGRIRLGDEVELRVDHAVVHDDVLGVAGGVQDLRLGVRSASRSASSRPFMPGITTSVMTARWRACSRPRPGRSASAPFAADRTR